MDLRHCVIPAAGLGTRFLPATKALPKELLPVVDRPVLQWGIEEALAAGAKEMVVVIARGKELIQAHFQPAPELEAVLRARGKEAELEAVLQCSQMANFSWVYQDQPLGLGHAVLQAAEIVGDNPFLCMLPDDLSISSPRVLPQLAQAFNEIQKPVLALMRVPKAEISRYGCATVAESRGCLHRITKVVEKPAAEDAESDLAIMGRYVLPAQIFSALRATKPGAIGEIQLTDGISKLIDDGEVWGLEFSGELLDVGTPQGWLSTNIRLARQSATLAEILRSLEMSAA